MKSVLVTIDMGNSRVKARRWLVAEGERTKLDWSWDAESAVSFLGAFDQWLASTPHMVDAVAYSAVGPLELEAELSALLARHSPRVLDRASVGLELEVRSPETVGADRLFAARGAAELVQSSALVVDAGTALTVDAVRWSAGASRPSFLGGAIAPGPRLLAQALALGGARLIAVEPTPGRPALGRDTCSAIEAGICVGFEGAALRLVRQIGEACGFAGPVVLTGGAAGFLNSVLPQAHCEPELVHLGLLATLGCDPRLVDSS